LLQGFQPTRIRVHLCIDEFPLTQKLTMCLFRLWNDNRVMCKKISWFPCKIKAYDFAIRIFVCVTTKTSKLAFFSVSQFPNFCSSITLVKTYTASPAWKLNHTPLWTNHTNIFQARPTPNYSRMILPPARVFQSWCNACGLGRVPTWYFACTGCLASTRSERSEEPLQTCAEHRAGGELLGSGRNRLMLQPKDR